MIPADLEDVVRAIILRALDDCPAIIPQDRRYADEGGQRVAKDAVASRIALALRSGGFLPMLEGTSSAACFDAARYTIQRMRTRLLRHVARSNGYTDTEDEAVRTISRAFFADLEERGWRLVQLYLPTVSHSTSHGPNG